MVQPAKCMHEQLHSYVGSPQQWRLYVDAVRARLGHVLAVISLRTFGMRLNRRKLTACTLCRSHTHLGTFCFIFICLSGDDHVLWVTARVPYALFDRQVVKVIARRKLSIPSFVKDSVSFEFLVPRVHAAESVRVPRTSEFPISSFENRRDSSQEILAGVVHVEIIESKTLTIQPIQPGFNRLWCHIWCHIIFVF